MTVKEKKNIDIIDVLVSIPIFLVMLFPGVYAFLSLALLAYENGVIPYFLGFLMTLIIYLFWDRFNEFRKSFCQQNKNGNAVTEIVII